MERRVFCFDMDNPFSEPFPCVLKESQKVQGFVKTIDLGWCELYKVDSPYDGSMIDVYYPVFGYYAFAMYYSKSK